MTEYRSDLPPRPPRMARLPLTDKGYPVLWFSFVDDDGKADLRVVGPGKRELALKHKVCWLCGEPLGRYLSFVVGPMCGINRVSAEPPQHLECAEYAVVACPFLTRPLATRNDRGLAELGTKEPGGLMIARNPGVSLIWTTRDAKPFRVPGGVLMRMGDPTSISFWSNGRKATRAEIDASIESGFPILQAEAEREGGDAVIALARQVGIFDKLLPPSEVLP